MLQALGGDIPESPTFMTRDQIMAESGKRFKGSAGKVSGRMGRLLHLLPSHYYRSN